MLDAAVGLTIYIGDRRDRDRSQDRRTQSLAMKRALDSDDAPMVKLREYAEREGIPLIDVEGGN